jgi:hypothetical protein
MPVNYQLGKIYQIIDYTNDNVYIGSTCEKTLARRLANHVNGYKSYLNGKGHYITSYKVLENGNYDILLIENFACESKDELSKKEAEHIRNTENCVNKRIEGRTIAQYRQDNKEIILQQAKQYYIDNKQKYKQYRQNNSEKIAEQRKQPIVCACGSEIQKIEKARHERTHKHKSFIEQQVKSI